MVSLFDGTGALVIALLSLAATFSVTVEQDQELSHAVRRSFTSVCCQHDALVFDTSMVRELLLEGGHTAGSPPFCGKLSRSQ